jgi:hypothetical protein
MILGRDRANVMCSDLMIDVVSETLTTRISIKNAFEFVSLDWKPTLNRIPEEITQ